jgi:hypothetical protein
MLGHPSSALWLPRRKLWTGHRHSSVSAGLRIPYQDSTRADTHLLEAHVEGGQVWW